MSAFVQSDKPEKRPQQPTDSSPAGVADYIANAYGGPGEDPTGAPMHEQGSAPAALGQNRDAGWYDPQME